MIQRLTSTPSTSWCVGFSATAATSAAVAIFVCIFLCQGCRPRPLSKMFAADVRQLIAEPAHPAFPPLSSRPAGRWGGRRATPIPAAFPPFFTATSCRRFGEISPSPLRIVARRMASLEQREWLRAERRRIFRIPSLVGMDDSHLRQKSVRLFDAGKIVLRVNTPSCLLQTSARYRMNRHGVHLHFLFSA